MPASQSSDIILPHPHAQGLSLLHLPAPFSLCLTSSAGVPLLRNLRTALRSLAEQQQVHTDVLVLTLGTAVSGGEYSLAMRMKVLDSLIADLGMRREHVVLLPDTPKSKKSPHKSSTSNHWRQWRYFIDFYNRFYQVQPEFYFINRHLCSLFKIPAFKLVLTSIQSLSTMPDERLGIASNKQHDGEAQIEWLARRLDNFAQNGWLRVGVLHDLETEHGDVKLKNLLNQHLNLALSTCKRIRYEECAMPVLSASNSDLGVAEAYQLLRVNPSYIEHWQGQMEANSQCNSLPPKQSLTVQLQQVQAAFPEPHTAALNIAESSSLEEADNFLSRVAAVCAMRAPGQVEVENIPAQQNSPAYLRVCLNEFGIARLYPICTCEDTPSSELLNHYCEQVVTRYRRNDPSVTPLFIYGGALPVSHKMRRAAAAWGVRLYSFVEYQGLIDFRGYLQEQAGLLNNSPDYLPELYVSQSLRFMKSQQMEHSSDALETLRHWLNDAYGRVLLLLGDSGSGKTFLLRELTRRLSEADDTLIPIWLPLRLLANGQRLENVIAQKLAANGVESFDGEAFHYMIAQGHVLLLLDGLDELAQAVGEQTMQEHLQKLFELAAGPYAKLVISVRSQHFQTDAEAMLTLPEHKPTLHYRLAWLESFSFEEIHTYLNNRFGEKIGHERYQLLRKLPGLPNLVRNPRLLQMLCELPGTVWVDAYQHWLSADAEGMTLMQVYAHLVKNWLQREQRRAERLCASHQKTAVLSLSARWHTLKALAQALWKKQTSNISAARLSAVVQQILWTCQGEDNNEILTAPLNSYQAGTTALLKRDHEGLFSLFDDSLLDWLIARQTASELENGNPAKALVIKPLRPLTVDFLLGKIGSAQALAWARRALATETDKIIRHNARLLMERLGDEQHQPLQLAGRNLCGKDLRDWDFRDADLRKTDFSDANLVGVDFSGANLTQATLIRADLTQASLRSCMLQDTDFTNAKLFGVDLHDAHLANTQFHRCGLIGAELSPDGVVPSIEHSDIFASAPPEPERLHPQLSCGIYAQTIAFSPDGQLFAAGGNRLAIWDAHTYQELRQFSGHTGKVRCLSFTPDGKFLISGSDDKTLRVWNLDTGNMQQCLEQHHAAVRCLALSFNGHKLASASWDQQIFLWLWDTTQQQFVYRALLPGHDGVVRGLSFSPDGRYLASASWDKTVRLWLVEHPAREILARAVLQGHTGFVRDVNFSPDGTHLASCSSDKSIRLWKLSTDCREGQEVLCLQGHQRGINQVEFSADGQFLCSAADDRSVRIWTLPRNLDGNFQLDIGIYAPDGSLRLPPLRRETNATEQKPTVETAKVTILSAENSDVQVLEAHRSPVLCLARHNTKLLSGGNDGTLRLWQLDSNYHQEDPPQVIEPSQINLTALAFSKDGQQLLCSGNDQRARLWQIRQGKILLDLHKHEAGVMSAAFSPDNKLLVTGCEDNRLYLWDAYSGKLLRRLLGHDSNVSALAFQPETGLLASGSWDKNICLWELEPALPGGRVVRSLSGHRGFIRHLNFSHDGSMLASASSDQTVKLWHSSGKIPSGQCLASFEGHGDCVRCVAFSTNDQWLVSGADDKSIRLWDLNAEEPGGYLLKAHHGAVNCLSFSPDGKLLASAGSDKNVILWEVGETAKEFRMLFCLHGHQGAINALQFSPNGRLLASAASDGSVHVWDVQRHQCILVLGHLKHSSVAFTPDGRYRLTGELDEQFWHVFGLYRLAPGEADAYMDKHVKVAEDAFLLF